MSKLHYNIIFQAEPEGGFAVLVPALPGCVTYGKNLTEAKKNGRRRYPGIYCELEQARRANSY